MKIEFDPAKNSRNIHERGLAFDRVAEFDFSTAKTWQDTRKPYPKIRLIILGYLENRLHILCMTPISHGIRVIRFRKANQ